MVPEPTKSILLLEKGALLPEGGGVSATVAPQPTSETFSAARAMGENAALPARPDVIAAIRRPAEAERRLLPRLRMFSDMPDRGLFIFFVVIGFALIIGSKTLLWHFGFAGDYSMVIACGAAVLMLAYGIIAYRMSSVRLRPDRLGDNFYYMGFIFTLASMSAALVQLQTGREIDSLIGSFGIALFSTIIGIAGRVAFIQMRTEIEDIEERSRQGLLDAATSLRGQLGAANRDLETFRLGVQQAIHERLTESANAFSSMAATQVGQIKETVESTISSVQAAFAAHERAADSLSQLGDKVTASVDNLVTRIGDIHVPPSLLEAKMDAMLAKLGETATAFERVADADMGRHKDLAAASAELRRVVTQITTQLGKLDKTTQTLRSAADPATEMAVSLAKAREALDSTANAARSLSESTLAARQASHELTGSIKAYGEMIVGVTTAQRASAAEIAEEAQTARRRAAQDLEESKAAVAEVQRVLAETARVVTEAINAPPSAMRG